MGNTKILKALCRYNTDYFLVTSATLLKFIKFFWLSELRHKMAPGSVVM